MKIDVNGISLYYEKTGSGKPILLLHGNGEDSSIFDVLAPSLAKGYTVYAIDSRGHGQSSPCDEISYDRMAQDIACFIEALGLHKPLLYGFSDGGIIGLTLAIRYPALLCKLAVSGANVTPAGLKSLYRFFFSVGYFFSRSPKVKMMLTQPQITAAQLSIIQIPVWVIAGANDLIKDAHTREIARHIPGSRLQILKGEGHGSYVIHSKKLYPVLYDFLQA